jgi:glycine/D-amino acid oxidase-like deaminating enzyme
MQFRSGVSLWRALAQDHPDAPPLEGDISCEALVIGGGVSGALVAERLVSEGLDTVLVDRAALAAESTAASTGLLMHEVDTPLVELIEKVGEQHAVAAYRRGLAAIDEIESLVATLADDCGFSRRQCLKFASDLPDAAALEREHACRRALGFDVEWLSASALADCASLRAPAAIRGKGDAQIDPYRFTSHVLARAAGRGLRVFAGTEVTAVERLASGFVAKTPRGNIRAGRVIYATGYGADEQLGRPIGSRHSTYVVASEPVEQLDGWPDGCLIWETARPYFYARQTPEGRILVGGEDTAYSDDHERDGLVEQQTERLVERFRAIFPRIPFQPACKWAGTFAETKDGLAYIGSPPGRDGEFFALGYGGNGITFSMIAARTIADLIVGRPNQDAEVFRFGR